MLYYLQIKVGAQIDRLECLGIISRVKTAEFSTTPNVLVLKPTSQVRIYGDFKVSANQYLDYTQFCLAPQRYIQTSIWCQVLSKLKIPKAYLQVKLDDKLKQHVVITTYRNLYWFNRLCFELLSEFAIL